MTVPPMPRLDNRRCLRQLPGREGHPAGPRHVRPAVGQAAAGERRRRAADQQFARRADPACVAQRSHARAHRRRRRRLVDGPGYLGAPRCRYFLRQLCACVARLRQRLLSACASLVRLWPACMRVSKVILYRAKLAAGERAGR